MSNTVVSCIYFLRFATLALVKSIGGEAYMWDLTYAPSSGATPRCWHRNIILQTNRSWFNTDLPSLLSFSGNSNTFWSRLTDKGWPQHTQRHFPSTPQVCPFNVLYIYSIDTTCRHAIVGEFLNWSVDTGFVLALPFHHGDLELDSVGLSTKDHVAILVAWSRLEGLFVR